MFSFERLSFCIKTVFYCSQTQSFMEHVTVRRDSTSPSSLLHSFIFPVVFFLPPSLFSVPFALLCCPNQCAHPDPFTLFLYNTHSSLLLVPSCIPTFFTTFLLNGAFHKLTPLSSSLPTLILPVCAFSRHTLLHSFCFSSSSCILWGSLSPTYPHPSSP